MLKGNQLRSRLCILQVNVVHKTSVSELNCLFKCVYLDSQAQSRLSGASQPRNRHLNQDFRCSLCTKMPPESYSCGRTQGLEGGAPCTPFSSSTSILSLIQQGSCMMSSGKKKQISVLQLPWKPLPLSAMSLESHIDETPP